MIKPVHSNSQEAKVMNKAKCPDCDAELDVPADTEKGEIVSCPGCGLELEVNQIKCGCVDLQEFYHQLIYLLGHPVFLQGLSHQLARFDEVHSLIKLDACGNLFRMSCCLGQ